MPGFAAMREGVFQNGRTWIPDCSASVGDLLLTDAGGGLYGIARRSGGVAIMSRRGVVAEVNDAAAETARLEPLLDHIREVDQKSDANRLF
jgi:hypothetical protein